MASVTVQPLQADQVSEWQIHVECAVLQRHPVTLRITGDNIILLVDKFFKRSYSSSTNPTIAVADYCTACRL